MQSKRQQASKRFRYNYRTAADHSTKSRQQANRTGSTYEVSTQQANPFRIPTTEAGAR